MELLVENSQFRYQDVQRSSLSTSHASASPLKSSKVGSMGHDDCARANGARHRRSDRNARVNMVERASRGLMGGFSIFTRVPISPRASGLST